MTNWIRWFDAVGMSDVAAVGGKNASLGEMRRAPNRPASGERIDSLSLNPDSQLKTTMAVVRLEKRPAQDSREPVASGATS